MSCLGLPVTSSSVVLPSRDSILPVQHISTAPMSSLVTSSSVVLPSRDSILPVQHISTAPMSSLVTSSSVVLPSRDSILPVLIGKPYNFTMEN